MAPENRTARRTQIEIAGAREAAAMAATLGTEVRRARLSGQLTQAAVARRIGLKRTRYGELERGDGASASLARWVAIGQAVGRPLSVSFTRAINEAQKAAGHLDLQELILANAERFGARRHFELPTRPAAPSLSVDVLLRLDVHRMLMIIEIWNRLEDIAAAARITHRKQAEAGAFAAVAGGERGPYDVASCWVLRDSAANRDLVRRYPAIFRAEFPGSSRAWVNSLETGARPPEGNGILWADPANGLSALNIRRPERRTP